jgi:hypothetical protein
LELIEHFRAMLDDFKKPPFVDFVTELPNNSTSKLSLKEVKERYWNGHGHGVA